MAIDRNKVLKQAESYMASGRYDRAIDEFLKLLDDNPRDMNLMNRMGDAYLQANRLPDALDMFKRSALGFERDGFNNKAIAIFKKANRAAPEDVDISGHLAELYRTSNMIKDAVQIHIQIADIFTKKGLIKRALEEFAKVVDLDPKNLKNKVKLADLYNKEGLKDRAASIYLEVAEALAFDQMPAEAAQILERAKTMVNTPQVYLTQSRLFVIQKDLLGAAAQLREGLKANPRNAELLEALAELELQSKNPDRSLEALNQIPQLPEKALQLCERAMRDLARAQRTEEALRLFKPIGRDYARRGLGEAVSQTLRAALQGVFTAEAWMQLAEIAHQSGNKAEQVDALRRAHQEATSQNDQVLAQTLLQQLAGLGINAEQLASGVPHALQPSTSASSAPIPSLEITELDPVRRMQIQQLERDAENYLRGRSTDRALDSLQKLLEIDPANRNAIERIADIHRASGVLTKVQMHYTRTAERLAGLGHKALASELLDKAEALFPGSTRFQRRMLGLEGITVPESAPAPAPSVIPLPPPQSTLSGSLDAIIALDVPGAEASAAPAPELPPVLPEPEAAKLEEALAVAIPPEFAALEPTLPPDLEPLELEPLPFAQGKVPMAPPAFPPSPAMPQLPPLPAEVPAVSPATPTDEDLASLLSDIDFQLDYGSPEEAKIEVENALRDFHDNPELLERLERAEVALKRLGHAAAPASLAEDEDFTHSFFDLTDVLSDALLETGEGEEMHDATNVVEKIQSVDELFNAFREGVDQQVKGDDYDTHYNLGIAYKEMMLMEPAMEEFKKALRDPERTLECCSMLSICEQEQGNLEAAAGWLHQGIDAPGFPPEDAIGLRYDLGELLEKLGRMDESKAEFQKVAEMDSEYREVAQKLG